MNDNNNDNDDSTSNDNNDTSNGAFNGEANSNLRQKPKLLSSNQAGESSAYNLIG